MPDRKGNIKCPACGEEMTEIFMPEQGINIDVCLNGCGGIFFNNREFKHFDAKDQNIDTLLDAMKGKNFSQVHDTTTRTCPICGAAMVKNYSSATKQIQVVLYNHNVSRLKIRICASSGICRQELFSILNKPPDKRYRVPS